MLWIPELLLLGDSCRSGGAVSTRTTQLYDCRSDDITLDEIERMMI